MNDPDVNADSWAIMVDKVYIRLESTLHCIILYKVSRSQLLTVTQCIINKHISSVCIIAENFYRCKHYLFQVTCKVFVSDMEKFIVIDNIMTILTNYHIGKYPLYKEDGNFYKQLTDK